MSDEKMLQQFLTARKVGTPLISITTFDQENTIKSVVRLASRENKEWPIIQWDCVRGWSPRNTLGRDAIEEAIRKTGIEIDYLNGETIETYLPMTRAVMKQYDLAQHLPEKSILFICNAQHRNHPSENYDVWQAISNLRETFAASLRSLVLLSPYIKIPTEVSVDILQLDEKLPTTSELYYIVQQTCNNAGIGITEEEITSAVDILRGIAAFPAEQTVAMSVVNGTVDLDAMWERKRQMINGTPGLRTFVGKEKFDDLGGCDGVKIAMNRVIHGKDSPRVIVFIDEGEKVFSGATGDMRDSTGVSQDFLATLLSYMEDNEADGIIFEGPPGTAKSAIAKTMGNEAGIPIISLDLGGMKDSLLGQSEYRLRQALKIIDAVGSSRAFFIMTSNKTADLPPELKRRFASGRYFFDLPGFAEREMIWPIHLAKYPLDPKQLVPVNDIGWTGAEIRNCVRMAYRQGLTLEQAANYIIPVSVSGARQLEQLRLQADGVCLSANYPGIYEVADIKKDVPSNFLKKTKKAGKTK